MIFVAIGESPLVLFIMLFFLYIFFFFTIGDRVLGRTTKSTIILFHFYLHNVQSGNESALSTAMISIKYISVKALAKNKPELEGSLAGPVARPIHESFLAYQMSLE